MRLVKAWIFEAFAQSNMNMKGKLPQSQKKSVAKKRVSMSRTERQVRVREVSLMAIGH